MKFFRRNVWMALIFQPLDFSFVTLVKTKIFWTHLSFIVALAMGWPVPVSLISVFYTWTLVAGSCFNLFMFYAKNFSLYNLFQFFVVSLITSHQLQLILLWDKVFFGFFILIHYFKLGVWLEKLIEIFGAFVSGFDDLGSKWW